MTTITDIANKALLTTGIQKRISSLSQDSAEAQTIALCIYDLRDELLRMAPWACAQKTANLVYITSSPGTPENTTATTTLWQAGQPPPPWAYEYQYPVDCLRTCWIIPATQTGFSGGIPITTAVTGGAASFWQGPPVKFTVQTDSFWSINAAAVSNGGTGYTIGDVITLASTPAGSPPIGAPAQLTVTSVSGGVITGVSIINAVNNSVASIGGSYFAQQTNPVAQGTTTGAGINATFTLTWNPAPGPQRIILTNQEFATMTYIQNVQDPDVMDPLFLRAWINVIAAQVCFSLRGDKEMANGLIAIANRSIETARAGDGNEGLTVNDVTPDWIRVRGIDFVEPYSSPFSGMDWGGLYPVFG